MGAAQEFRENWRLLVAVMVSAIPISIPLYSTGIFMPVWQKEFGWSRTQIALGISCYMLALTLASPFIGGIVDRFGARRPILLSIAAGLVAVFGLSLIGPQIWTLYIVYFLLALVSSACTPAALTRPVGLTFDKGRGLAFGITLSATTICMLVVPPLSYALYVAYGWRVTYHLLAIGLTPVFAVAFWGLRERDRVFGEHSRGSGGHTSALDGMTLKAAMRQPIFWLLALSFSLTVFVSTGASGQMVPILTEKGFTTQQAVLIQPAMAIGLGVSRLVVGTLIDRFRAVIIYRTVCCAAACGFLGLISPFALLTAPSIFLIGAALGAEFDILAFMVSRYFGLAHYARIFACIYVGNIIGAMLGPVYFASMHDLHGNYHLAMLVASGILLGAALLMTRVAPYPEWCRYRIGSRAVTES